MYYMYQAFYLYLFKCSDEILKALKICIPETGCEANSEDEKYQNRPVQ